ncbi:N-6 DNA methylase [Priestia flexa]|uniref:N-6 DNA methylase n=1 Tax=Priestia flexa TaxID=86664 RepID=UPI0004730E32|nr:N-6 DNA methylase [Priestia flexa]
MYKNLNIKVPTEKRKEINNKIIHVIDNNIKHPQITPEIIFNMYSGNGGLHGLNFKDHNNYHEFKLAKQEKEQGAFFTPLELSKFMTDVLKPSESDLIADLTAGHGALINWLPKKENVYVNELDLKSYKVLKHLFPDANVTNKDIRLYESPVLFDIVLGNPPFNIKFNVEDVTINSQFYYMKKAYQYLKPAGLLAFIVPNSFLSDSFADATSISFVNTMYNHIKTFVLPANIFHDTGANIETKIIIFQKKSEFLTDQNYSTERKQVIENLHGVTASNIYTGVIKPLYEQKNKVKNKIILETGKQSKEEEDFNFKVKKLLFDIKRTKKTKHLHNKAEMYLIKYQTQEKPQEMKYEDWLKIRLTKTKVLSYLKRILRNQHRVTEDAIRLVKTKNSIKLKAYSPKTKQRLAKMNGVTETLFQDLVRGNSEDISNGKFLKLIEKKRRKFIQQNQNWYGVTEVPYIARWLRDFTINDSENNQQIKLNKIQQHDTMRMLQKDYGYLQWGTGAGKSISMIAQFTYRMKHNNIRNTFIVAPAIAINNNWDDILKSYGYDVARINSLQDVQNIKRDQIVIMTFNMLVKYQRHIKKYVKMQSNKIMFCLDEADAICNPSSKRTKAVFNCFSNAKYKLLASATSTRNNIPESFTAFSFLYKSSMNFISECEHIYVEDRKTKEIKEELNKYYNKPFPMYKKGHTLFKRCFSPEKATVFGVGKQNQDIYHADKLSDLINKTMITRTFEEVSGKDLYEIKQNTCTFNSNENEVYRVIVEEFYKLSHMYKTTGNHRKDALLRIIQQLNSLLRACVTPNIFNDYRSTQMPSKAVKTLEMLDEWKDERVVIGATHVKTVTQYANYIRSKYPNRKLFIITGESTTLNKRKEIIKELKKTKDGILICTQQSLSSSMNIDFINKVLLVELMYNFASMHQFFARFIRYTSTEQKEIHFLTVENTIESNLLKLIMSKEKLNNFMKNNFIDDEEIMDQFGVDFDILSMLMSKETDEDGKSYIQWGNQKVI